MGAAAGLGVSRNRKALPGVRVATTCSGEVTILMRFHGGRGFNAKTTAVLDQWPLLARSGEYQVRQPVARGRPGQGDGGTVVVAEADAAAMGLRDRLHNGKPQTGPRPVLAVGAKRSKGWAR